MSAPTKALRAVLYARVSTTDQNPAMQLDELRAVAAQRGWTVIAEHVDVARTLPTSSTMRRRFEYSGRATGNASNLCLWAP